MLSPASSTHAVMDYCPGSNAELEEKVRSGKVVIGRLRVYRHYTQGLAFVGSPSLPCDVVLNTMEARRNALHGDVVAVELLPETQWPPRGADGGENSDGDTPAGEEEAVVPDVLPDGRPIRRWLRNSEGSKDSSAPECLLAKKLSAPAVHDFGGKQPAGVVVAVLKRSRPRRVVARLLDGALTPDKYVRSNRYYQFKGYDPLMPNIAVFGRGIPSSYHDTLDQKIFYLNLVTESNGDFRWTEQRFLTGTIECVLGDVDCVKTNSFALCTAFDVSMKDFSEEAYACVPKEFCVPDARELQKMGRRDLRKKEFVCSIDPATARDLDDALSICAVSGGYRVGVHIADVSYFVPVASPLDEEARERSTSVYLVEQVIPMLPRKLSEDYCSLNPGSDKFAFSCIFDLDRSGKVKSEWFGQSVIRNRCRLTYDQAQRILDGDKSVFDTLDFGGEKDVKSLQKRVSQTIRTLFELASKLRETSLQRGRLTIGNMKIRFCFEDIANPTTPLGFRIERQINANWLVEEFMLLANTRVAEKIVEYMPEEALLRCQPPLDRKKAAALKSSLSELGFEVRGRKGGFLQAILEEAKESEYYDEICVMLKYALQAARYIANGLEGEKAYRSHCALALPWYTHFTSPIRRYCDIIAHRQLLCALEIESIVKKNDSGSHRCVLPEEIDVDQLLTRQFFYSAGEVESIVEVANDKKLKARQVSDSSLALFFCQYLKAQLRIQNAGADGPNGRFTPRVRAIVVRVVEKSRTFLVFVKEVAQEVEISLRSREQRFKGECAREDGEGRTERDKKKEVEGKKELQAKKKKEVEEKEEVQAKKKKPQGEDKKATSKLCVDWGPHPETGEEVTEELGLLKELTGVLTIKKSKGYEEVNIIIDPPWERTVTQTPFCTSVFLE